jgi:hypothetical protein
MTLQGPGGIRGGIHRHQVQGTTPHQEVQHR